MASLIIDTGVQSHPQIAVDTADFQNGLITFRWIGGPYGGDCAEPFLISLADHGELTINEVVSQIGAYLLSKLSQ